MDRWARTFGRMVAVLKRKREGEACRWAGRLRLQGRVQVGRRAAGPLGRPERRGPVLRLRRAAARRHRRPLRSLWADSEAPFFS